MKALLMQIAVWILRITYLPFSLLKLKEQIVIISKQADMPTIDLRLLKSELEGRGRPVIILSKKLNKSMRGGIKYALHMLRQMYYIATSKIIILDGYCILVSILPKKRKQTVLQIWHSLGAIKKFGYQTLGKTGGNKKYVAKIMKLHRNYDWIIAPGMTTARFFTQGFGADISKVKLIGLPRIDYLTDENDIIGNEIRKEYPEIDKKDTVLYAPTFRKGKNINFEKLISAFDFTKYNLVIKKHWLDKTNYEELQKYGVIVDKKFGSIDWLKICKKVISDYSGIIFEAAILRKEIYLYFYDISEYKDCVGMNMDFSEETLARYSYVEATTLCREMENKYDVTLVDDFRNKYITVKLKNCTGGLADFVESFLEKGTENYNEFTNKKQTHKYFQSEHDTAVPYEEKSAF